MWRTYKEKMGGKWMEPWEPVEPADIKISNVYIIGVLEREGRENGIEKSLRKLRICRCNVYNKCHGGDSYVLKCDFIYITYEYIFKYRLHIYITSGRWVL